MSFYTRGYGGLGALPSFELGGNALTQGIVNAFLDQVPSGSPGGLNGRQLIARANELQAASRVAASTPEGAAIASAAAEKEGTISAAWGEVVAFATKLADLLENDPLKNLGPRPGPDLLDPQGTINKQAAWDIAWGEMQRQSNNRNAAMEDLSAKMKRALANSLGPALKSYVVGVSDALNLLRASKTAKTEAVIAEDQAKTTGLKIDTFIAEQKLAKEQKTAADLAKATSRISTGISPLMIAAIGIPVLGVAAYFLTKKKSSVAGYRRRRSRR